MTRPEASLIAKQNDAGREKNAAFLRDRPEDYRGSVNKLDTYQNIRAAINAELQGRGATVGCRQRGTFDYYINLVGELVAVDLFLEDPPDGAIPPKVQAKNDGALELPFPDESFNGVVMGMLIHHLIEH